MKLSCLPVSFFQDIIAGRMTIGDWARMAADLKLDAVDLTILFFPDHTPEITRRVRREIEALGLEICMLSTYPDFTHPDAAQRQRELEQELQAMELAEALGIKLVRVTAGQAHPSVSRAAGTAWAIEGLTRLVEATRGATPTLVYENHGKPGVWQYTDFSAPGEIFLDIARATAAVRLGIHFDTANATAYTPDPLALLSVVLERVVSVHVADTAVTGRLEPVVIGTGIAPIPLLLRRLRMAGWDNWLCIEEAARQGRAGVESAVRYTRQAWEAAGRR